jgi:Tfp pilus assembly protein PilF
MRRKAYLAALVAGTLAAVAVLIVWANWHQPPGDGSKSEPVTFRNTAPGVKYVGDKVCGKCHASEYQSYREHPMGRSMAPVADPLLRSAAAEAVDTFAALGSSFRIERRGTKLYHQEIYRAQGEEIGRLEEEVHYAIGSGRQGRSFLIDHGGFLYQSPISWYARAKRKPLPAPEQTPPLSGQSAPKPAWDLSPGYADNFQHFSRPITNNCLFCHSDRVNPVEDSVNQYRQPVFSGQLAVGCERCHGPGELHVRDRTRGLVPEGEDRTIVNPGKLARPLREAVCQQCHILGEVRITRRGRHVFDYRPGLPLHEHVAIFVRPPEKADQYKSVSHVEQMYVSRCFRESTGKTIELGCITCHDPHRLPEADDEKVTHYRSACLKCHNNTSCKLKAPVRRQRRPDDNCIGCHMPRASSSNITHAAVTDHRIVRDRDHPPRVESGLRPGAIPLVSFHSDLLGPDDRDTARDLALAMVSMARSRATGPLRLRICERALPDLESATEDVRDDVAAWEALGYVLWQLRRLDDALTAYRQALTLAPQREVALLDATRVALALGQYDTAYTFAKRHLAVNPWDHEVHSDLAIIHMKRSQWAEAFKEADAAVRLNPGNIPSRLVHVSWYLRQGDKSRAASEFRRLMALGPRDPEKVRQWFEQESKQARGRAD